MPADATDSGGARAAPARALAVAALLASIFTGAILSSTPRRVGDGGEYLVMAMRLASFESPALTGAELSEWKDRLRTLGAGFEASLLDYPGLVGPDGRQAFLHFWLYPLLAVPGVWLTKVLGVHPNWAFTLTNATMLIAASFAVARMATPMAAVYAFLGPVIWWLDKAHTEAFLFAALAAAAVWVSHRPSAAMLTFALAGAQNAALGVVYPLFAAVAIAMRTGTRPRREWLAAIAGGGIVALPMIYFFIHVGAVSPMTEYAHVVTPWPRALLAFLLEPNIGLVPSAPAYLVALAGLTLAARRPSASALIVWWPAIVSLVLLVVWSQNPNANHGGTPGVNRWVLSLLPLSLPWATAGFADRRPWLRRALCATTIVCAGYSSFTHLPKRPENYRHPTSLARALWSRGVVAVTTAEVFAERSEHVEPPVAPAADELCEVLLAWSMQIPIACVPPDAEFPDSCGATDAFCFAVPRGGSTRVVPAYNNGFFFHATTRTWPAAGPLASGVRRVLLSLDPTARRWDVVSERPWIRRRDAMEAPILLHRSGRVFMYIARTGASPSLTLDVAPGMEATLYTLVPAEKVSTVTATGTTLDVVLPGGASNLAIAVSVPAASELPRH